VAVLTIWVNVTTSAHGHYPPFGIMRVEQNIARALQAALGRDRVGFCTWDNRGRTFLPRPDVELDPVAI